MYTVGGTSLYCGHHHWGPVPIIEVSLIHWGTSLYSIATIGTQYSVHYREVSSVRGSLL